jgi:hypothetical protein
MRPRGLFLVSLPPHIFPKRSERKDTLVFPPAGGFPDLQLAGATIATRGRQASAMRTKRYADDGAALAGGRERFQPTRRVPQPHGLVGARRCQAPAIRTEGQAMNNREASCERRRQLAAGSVPNRDLARAGPLPNHRSQVTVLISDDLLSSFYLVYQALKVGPGVKDLERRVLADRGGLVEPALHRPPKQGQSPVGILLPNVILFFLGKPGVFASQGRTTGQEFGRPVMGFPAGGSKAGQLFGGLSGSAVIAQVQRGFGQIRVVVEEKALGGRIWGIGLQGRLLVDNRLV